MSVGARARPGIAILALVAATGCRSSGPRRYVTVQKNAQGVRREVPFWTTADAMQGCMQEGMQRLAAGIKAIEAFEGGKCAEGRIGDLGHGTPVELMPASPECKHLARVKVLDGDAKGKAGCVPPEVLSDHVVP